MFFVGRRYEPHDRGEKFRKADKPIPSLEGRLVLFSLVPRVKYVRLSPRGLRPVRNGSNAFRRAGYSTTAALLCTTGSNNWARGRVFCLRVLRIHYAVPGRRREDTCEQG